MRKYSKDKIAFAIIGYTFLTIFALLCFLPFIMVLSGSLSDEASIINNGYGLLPTKFSLEAYSYLLEDPAVMLRAYGVTVIITVCGTFLGLFLTSMTAYVLQRKDFELRNVFAYYFFFTTLFSGGLVPWYILMIDLHMKNNILAMILPGLIGVFNIIVMRTFMSSISESITESAKIDGAGDFRIFVQIMLPMSKPALATIGLFMALGYWNEWYNAMMYISKPELYPLQYYLYKMLNTSMARKNVMNASGVVLPPAPSESLKLAMTVMATGPILLLYPYLQKYFIKGITIGAVKG